MLNSPGVPVASVEVPRALRSATVLLKSRRREEEEEGASRKERARVRFSLRIFSCFGEQRAGLNVYALSKYPGFHGPERGAEALNALHLFRHL